MHNTMRMVLSNIHNNIPEPILNIAFNPMNSPISIDQLIHEKVIKNRVTMECNLVGGERKSIILSNSMRESSYWNGQEDMVWTGQENMVMAGTHSLYRIPPEVRDHRAIVSVINVDYPNYGHAYPHDYVRPGFGATASRLARAALESHTMSSGMSTPRVELKGPDLIQLFPAQYGDVNWVLSCNLGYDEYFTNLNPQAVLPFMDLTLSATKSYIYNRMAVVIDQARIIHGSEQGVIRDIITKYEGEEERYKELLNEFTGGVTLDPVRMERIIRMIL